VLAFFILLRLEDRFNPGAFKAQLKPADTGEEANGFHCFSSPRMR